MRPLDKSRPPVLVIQADDVRAALESIRQATHPGDSPLHHMVLVWQRAQTAGPVTSADALDAALRNLLFEIISDQVVRLRRIEGRGQYEDTRKAQLAALADDYTYANPELEAWSALYYRYVRLDLNLQVQDIARQVNSDARQVRRRLSRGVGRLVEALGALESSARAEDRRLWKRLKLPPLGYGTLFGVEGAIAALRDALAAPGPPWLAVVVGAGGLGKTTLAHATLSRLAEEDAFADLAWVDIDGPLTHTALLGRLARRLGYPHLPDGAPGDLEHALRAILSDTRIVVVLDNADLLEGYPTLLDSLAALVEPGKLLLTARRWPGSQTPAHIVSLAPLPREAVEAFIRQEGQSRGITQAEHLTPDALDTLYDAIGGNPLAVRLVLGQLARLPLARVLDNPGELRTDEGTPLFEVLFERTWETLDADARQLALACLLIPNEGAFWRDLLLLSDLPEDRLDAAITQLTASALLEALGPVPRYAVHALTRRFLEQLAAQDSYAPTFKRLLAAAASRAAGLFEREDEDASPSPPNLSAWLQLMRWQAEVGVETDLLERLVTQVAPGARRAGQWERWMAVLERAGPHLSGNGLARARLEAGVALRWIGETDEAVQAFEEAIALSGEGGDFVAQAEALVELGALLAASGQRAEAALAFQRAVAAAERYAAHDSLRRALNGLAMLALQDEAIDETLALLRRALEITPDQPDALTLSNLGVACLRAGLTEEAVSFQQEALSQYETAADLPDQARAQVRLASAHAEKGDYDAARAHFEAGLALMRALGDALGQARALVNLGAAHRQQGQLDEAIVVWLDALALQRHLGDELGMAYTWYNLGDVYWAAEDELAAREALSQAARLAETTQSSTLLDSIDRHPSQQA